jgi:hypothetical protein
LRVRKRRRTQRGKCPPPDSDPLTAASLEELTPACQDNSPQAQISTKRFPCYAACRLHKKLTPESLEDPAPELRLAIPVEQGETETVTEVLINCHRTRPHSPFLFTHTKRVAAIIAALSFLFVGLWFGASTRHAPPQSSYPYYDTQKPVPPWSEPKAITTKE